MLAHRLAAYVAHDVDVEAVLDSITEEQFRLWAAFDLIEPLGPETLYEVLSRIGAVTSAAWGGTHDPEDFIPRRLPPDDTDDEVDGERATAEYEIEAARQIAAIGSLVERHNSSQ